MQNTKIPSITDTKPLAVISVPKQILTLEEVEEKHQEVVKLESLEADKLLKALYWVWDAFDRANVPYFLVYQTAEDVIAQKDLSGDRVTVGIRKPEWLGGGRRLLDAFLGNPIIEEDNYASYDHEGVPVIIHIFEDHECIQATDAVQYRYETFKVPNPYSTFTQVFTR